MRDNVLITVLLVLTIVASGCTASENPETNPNNTVDDPDNKTDSSDISGEDQSGTTEASEEEDRDFRMEYMSVDYPDEVVIGEEFNVTIEVRNIDNVSGKFKTPVDIRADENQSVEIDTYFNDSEIIEPGESHIFNETFRFNKIDSYDFDLGPVSEINGDVEIKPKERTLGESVESLKEVEMTLENLRFEEKPEREGFRYALLDFKATNNAEEPRKLPETGEFELLLDTRGNPVNKTEFGDLYESETVQPGESRSGVLVYEVLQDSNRSTLEFNWRPIKETNRGAEIPQDGIKWISEEGSTS